MANPYSNTNPPPVDFTPPPMQTYASKYPGSHPNKLLQGNKQLIKHRVP